MNKNIRFIPVAFFICSCVLISLDCFGQGKISRNKDTSNSVYNNIPRVLDVSNCKIGNFSDSVAIVNYKDYQGVIDVTGKLIIPFKKNFFLSGFSDGLCVFRRHNSTCGYINKKGGIVLNSKYIGIGEFKEGLVREHTMILNILIRIVVAL